MKSNSLRLKRTWRSCLSLCLGLVLCTGLLCGQVSQPQDAEHGDGVPENLQLFLLVGQSNMAGRGKLQPEDRVPHPQIWVLDKHDEWVQQGEPIHYDKPFAGVGLSYTFAKALAAENPDMAIGLIPCAVGGTPIRRWKPGGDLFEAAIARVKIAQQHGELRAILWHQGESECGSRKAALAYANNLEKVATGFRDALGQPDLPFIAGELGEFLYLKEEPRAENARLINRAINELPSRVDYAAVVSSGGLVDGGDQLHFDSASQKQLGIRYFFAYGMLINDLSLEHSAP